MHMKSVVTSVTFSFHVLFCHQGRSEDKLMTITDYLILGKPFIVKH